MINPTELMLSILKSEHAQLIIDRISPIYGEARVFLWLLQAVGVALDEAELSVGDFDVQSNVTNATWSLDYYEDQYGVRKNTALSLEDRRANVFAAIRFKVPLNPEKVASIMSAIGKTYVTIEEHTGKNKFTVHSRNTMYADRMIAFLEAAKTAHTIYEFEIDDKVESEEGMYGGFHAITVPVTTVDFGGLTILESRQTSFNGFHTLAIPVTSVDFGGEE